MFKTSKNTDPRKVDTFIGKETSMSGHLNSKGTVRVDGLFEGEIAADSDVIIGGEATVKAQVKGNNVTLAGRLEGDVEAANKLEILSSGALLGNIKTGVLSIEEGGYFSGYCNMVGHDKNKNLKKLKEEDPAVIDHFQPGESHLEHERNGKKQGDTKTGVKEQVASKP